MFGRTENPKLGRLRIERVRSRPGISSCLARSAGILTPCYDEAAARNTPFGGIVVQGGVTSAILNAVVAENLPGPGTVFLQTNWSFKAPVRPGDSITGEVKVIKVRDDKPITELDTRVSTGDGTLVLSGTAVCYTMPIQTV